MIDKITMTSTRRAFFASLPALASGLTTIAQDAPVKSDFVATQAGELPIIVSAPHGGDAPIPGVPVRKGEGLARGGSGFATARDGGTRELALAVAAAVDSRQGKKPYHVVARSHRKFLDPNRPAEIAFEDARAKPVYDAYHQALGRACREVQQTFGRGLLLDVHGQGSARDTDFRGTKNGKTVALLVQRYGEPAHNGSKSFFGLLAATGWKVHPTDGGPEQPGLSGGYILQTYGSHTAHDIDAIQLEFGGDFRTRAKVQETAARLADVIAAYAKLYLLDRPAERKP